MFLFQKNTFKLGKQRLFTHETAYNNSQLSNVNFPQQVHQQKHF